MNNKLKSAIESYLRSFIVAAVAVYSTGETDIKAIGIAGLAAIAGPVIRAINPKDPAFGFIADSVDKELKKATKRSPRNKKTK
jgi:hypothetical protein